MAIIKRGVNTYLIRVYLGRHPITKKRLEISKTIHGTLKEAEKQEQLMKSEAAKGETIRSADMTFQQLAGLYIDETRYFRSAVTQRLLKDRFDRYVLPYLGNHKIKKIKSSDIQQLFNFLLDPKKGNSDVKKK